MELIETMKKQHVMNFAMHHELVNAVQVKQSIEEWRTTQIKKTKTSATPLYKDIEEMVADLKQIWRTFNELISNGRIKMIHKGEETIQAKNLLNDQLKKIEISWVKLERHGSRIVKTFGNLCELVSSQEVDHKFQKQGTLRKSEISI